ncbi:toll-like receptor 13 [Patella vulgata]|uniref:toll-like receptor 13 n=1 Tax=Patella vulgata TaxID=6465 RepID=UPI00218020AC|nr:toll-like receptor 13 [Patella vulgata]
MGGKILTSILLLVLGVMVKQDYGSFVVSKENCRCYDKCESCCYFDFESLKQLIVDEACSISSSGLIKSPIFNKGSRLEYLNMSNNNLECLPKSIQKLRSTNIDISNNSLVCNCSNLWLGEWFRSKPNIKYRSLLTCSVSGNQDKIKIQDFQKGEHDCEVINSTLISIVLGIFGILLIVSIICFIYFRYELLTLYYIYIKSRLRRTRTIKNESETYDICVLLNETNDSDRLWVRNHLIRYFEENTMKSYIPYRDGVIGEVTSDAIITNMNNSSTVLAVVSSSFFANPLNIFNLEAAYHQKIRNGNGKLILIKLGQDCLPYGSNGYIRAMFRLKRFIHADNQKLMSKLTSQIQLQPKYKSRTVSVTSEDILWF